MPITQVAICNLALSRAGQAPIQSLTQETRTAQLLNSIFPLVQDRVMSAHPWNFTIKRAAWTPNANTPVYEYDYEYDLPSDCLKVLSTENNTEHVIENRKLLSNESTLKVRFIYRNNSTNEWSAWFANVMAWALAEDVSYALNGASERTQQIHASYEKALKEDRSTDATEGDLPILEVDDWTNSRR
jgi:hypothetical protein